MLKQEKCLTVFYDGECRVCSLIKKQLDNSEQENNINFKDVNKDLLPSTLERTVLQKELHAIDENGNIFKNDAAALKILETHPQFKMIAKIGYLPIFRQVFKLCYKLLASNRKYFYK